MAAVKYVGIYDFRVLSAADAKRANPPVTDFTKTTWARNETKEVSDAASEWLLRDLPEEFVAGESSTPTTSTSTRTASTSTSSTSKTSSSS